MMIKDRFSKKDFIALVISIAVCLSAGIVGSLFTKTGPGSWYETINKPAFNPPGWVFGPVWTLLFILMGISLFLVWKAGSEKRDVKLALSFFGLQLMLNILWSALFFGIESPGLAFIEILILWSAILGNITIFYRISRTASALLVPYLFWVTFASILNVTIWFLNRPF